MKITKDTATSLGEKLATLELSSEEAVLLSTLFEDESEVVGFNNFEEVKVTYRPAIRGPVENKWIDVLSQRGYTEVEWTY